MFGQICGYYGWAKLTHKTNYTPETAVSNTTIVVQSLSPVQLFATPASLSFTTSQSLLKLMSIESVVPSDRLTLCCPFSSCLLSSPACFPVSWLLASGGQSIRVSGPPSVLPKNIQGWFLLRLTGFISLKYKGLSRVFSNTTVQKHQFFSAQLSL